MTATHTPAEVFPAGEYLRDELDERGWTVTEFAEIIDRPIQAVSEILNGKKEITAETAISFGDALGTSAEVWLNLQTNFRLWVQQRARPSDSPVARRARLRHLLPLSEVRSRGWLPPGDDLDQLESATCHLLEIASVHDTPTFALAARRANHLEEISIEQSAWIARVRQLARSRSVGAYQQRRLEQLASRLPRLLVDGASKLRELPSLFADAGVVLVFLPGLRGGKLDGAVTVLENGTPVIGVTARGDRFDIVAFTLLHECAHLTLGHITPDSPSNSVWIDDEITGSKVDPREVAADEQAGAWIFPEGFEIESARVPAILAAATRYGVHPSVVIGQLHHERGDYKLLRSHIPKVRDQLPDEDAMP